jgi:hypothetical protein
MRIAGRLHADPARGYRSITAMIRTAFGVGIAVGVAVTYAAAAILGALPARGSW